MTDAVKVAFDFLYLGSVPSGEDCLQVGTASIAELYSECRKYKAYLERLFPIPPELINFVQFRTKAEHHDFGTYYCVIVKYDASNEAALNFALNVENNEPEKWDYIGFILPKLLKEG